MKKFIRWTAIIVLLLVIIGGVTLYFTLNGIVRRTVASSATNSLKVQTSLGGASVAPFSGNVRLSDLEVASPEGFSAPKMFELGGVAVDVSYGQLLSEPVRVKSIKLTQPKLVIEQAGGKVNFKALMDNLQDPNKPAPDPNAKPVKVIIDDLQVEGAQVVLRPGIPGLSEEITLKVPPISMTNVGNADGTQTGSEVGRVLMDVVAAMAKEAANSDQLPPEVRQLLNLNVDQIAAELGHKAQEKINEVKDKVTDEVNKQTDKAKEAIDEQKKKLGDQLDKNLSGLDKNIGGLLGGDKKSNEKKKDGGK